ncbi:tRNA-splicing endonuclease subunit Sen34 [Carcharodon carcharias]|uniref:tRNA-splicing endonuclease subunit Sen34 n=1 Tax=Carcharodon carcharias TaxID=13397 RepID=UPI001B7E5A5F|nr:tRNA-splicing endonuclease subunit Sen34 [Carcharodon carcharias]XP_041038308.1 tRNA-splicing endonuclease subunit Sen34 [Carcharodon carcharias]
MILIHVRGGRALVWSAEEAQQLRENHGLCGSPVGSLARQPRQNCRLGLPLLLLPEEAQLLAEEGLGLLVKPRDREEREEEEEEREEERERHRQLLGRLCSEQRQLALQEKRKRLEGLSERIREGRRHKRTRRLRGDTAPEAGDEGHPGPLKELEELERTFTFPPENTLVQIHTICPRPRRFEVVDWRLPSDDWPYPADSTHALRYCVFKDLRAKGYQLTSGGKFGGDFLVYPGDPMRFHAHYIAICLPFGTGQPLQDTVTAGRLGSNVKKTILLCSVTEQERVVYTSVCWRGIQ